ncbi:PilZ domain protein [Geotalea daltonii FRC-32]|uniref:PilZ domain protein n=1 Tax=Geotalea daltonii (strain DSM 22248 / JCM 15807 / FRC-32) TaxID=316067 RepID=B9M970_GEODF|nr:PilZ domain-containing protein [Geotalea daltonii]ACM18628.1 PilZ domain protein [Geotalea daltonii FRC-32]
MESLKVLVVSREGEAMDAYGLALEQIGVNYDVASSFRHLSSMVRKEAYNGMIVDMLTLVRAGKDEKRIAYELMNFFPATHVKWDTRHKSISLSLLGQMSETESVAALRTFIEEKCRPFRSRRLRMYPRKELILNILLSPDPSFPEGLTEKTFTVNVSKGGCFLHTVGPLENGQTVWLKIHEFSDQTPIKAVICWKLAWGEQLTIPGIGVKVEETTPMQMTELSKLLQSKCPGAREG